MKKTIPFFKQAIASLALITCLAANSTAQISITEIMYNPPESGSDSLEFIEFVNTTVTTIHLNGYSFVEGVSHNFTANDSILAGQFAIIAGDSAAFRNVFGFDADFIWTSGALSNGGEDITIKDNFGALIDSVDYDDGGLWDSRPDAGGPSLVLCDSLANNNIGESWYAAQTAVLGGIVNGIQIYANPGAGANCFIISPQIDTNISCPGQNDGSVSIQNIGGTNPISYSWSTGDTLNFVDTLSAGTYKVTATDSTGLVDSLEFTLVEPPVIITTLVDSACVSYTWSTTALSYDSTGMYFDTTTTANGCDSINVLDLTILQTRTDTTVSVCDTNFYVWRGDTLRAEGLYRDTLLGASLCDSILELNLFIGTPTSLADTVITCDSYVWQGDTLTAAGDYFDTIPNAKGCDSLLSLNLSFTTPSSSSDTVVACELYVWLGDTLTTSGTYFDTIPSTTLGCDSLLTLELTILNATTATVRDTACDTYNWALSGQTYTTSGQYIFVDTNSLGCDSVITLDLLILNSNSSSEAVDVCKEYTWPQTGLTYNSTGVYTDTITNSLGCDSVLFLNLTIRKANNTIIKRNFLLISQQANATSYQWIDCVADTAIAGATGQQYLVEENGTYAVEVNFDGCVDTSFCIEIVNVGIEEYSTAKFSFSPNPANDYLNFKFENSPLNAQVLQIMDITGSMVKEFEISSKNQQLDISDLNNGIYIIRYGNSMKKLIVSK
ncbi:MAG: lamin tail domain-containing protein [Vicingaceae bacterium]